MANSVDPDQSAPIGAVCSGSTLFASLLNLSVMLAKYFQQTTSADNIFRCIFFLALSTVSFVWLSFNVPVNSLGHVEVVSYPNHNFSLIHILSL